MHPGFKHFRDVPPFYDPETVDDEEQFSHRDIDILLQYSDGTHITRSWARRGFKDIAVMPKEINLHKQADFIALVKRSKFVVSPPGD